MKTAKTLAEECCANNLLKWAKDWDFKIEWIDGDDAIRSKMETFNEPTHSDQQPSVSVAITVFNAEWLDADVVDKKSWLSRFSETEKVRYGVTAYVRDSETAVHGSSSGPAVDEHVAMLVSFKKGAR